MLDSVGKIQPEDVDSHLRHQWQLCVHTGVVSFQETPKVPVADTVGAGDSFTAAFCASILNGKPVPEAHKLAVEVSAYVCTQRGAMPELPQVLKDRLM